MKCATCINRVMKSCLEPIDKALVNNCKGSPDYSTYVVYFSVGCMIGNAIWWTSN